MTRTDSAGRFSLKLAERSPHDVRVEARGLGPVRLDGVLPGNKLVVTLSHGRAIEGTVRDGEGRGVPGARVTAISYRALPFSPWESDAGTVSAATDARGRFRLEGLGPGLHSVRVAARGYRRATKPNVHPGATVGFTLHPGGWIAGRVLDTSGAPVEGARVLAEGEGPSAEKSSTETTDSEGRFALEGLSPGRYTILSFARAFALGLEPHVILPSEGPIEVTINLTDAARIAGRVVDPQQRPLRGRVQIQGGAGQDLPPAASALLMAETDEDGRFQLERVPSGAWTVELTAAGRATRRIEADIGIRERLVNLGEVVLDRGATIHGRIRSASHAAVAGATIEAHGDTRWVSARSDEGGSFILAGLAPDEDALVYVRASGFAPLREMLTPGPQAIDLVLSPGGAVAGLVVTEGGLPVDSYHLEVDPEHAFSRLTEDVGSSDGRFRLEDLAEDTYDLRVAAPEHAPGEARGLKVLAGRTTDAGTIRLSRGGVVRGTVVDADDNAVAGATVKAVGNSSVGWRRWEEVTTAFSDSAGRFEISGLGPGHATVAAGHSRYASSETTVWVEPTGGPADVRLSLDRGGRIEGSARRRDGTPLSGLLVSVEVPKRSRYSFFGFDDLATGSDGSFALERVPVGGARVSLATGRGPDGETTASLAKYVEVREGETTAVDFVSREILLAGRATRSGTPLAGLRLELSGRNEHSSMSRHTGGRDAPAGTRDPQDMGATTAEDGSYALIVDEPGRFTLDVRSASGKTHHYPGRNVDIPDLESYVLDLDFPGTEISGLIIDSETGQPVPAAVVWAEPKPPPANEGADGQTGSADQIVRIVDAEGHVSEVKPAQPP